MPLPVEQARGPASPATRVAGEGCSRHCSVRGGVGVSARGARSRSPAPCSRTALHRNDVTGKRMAAREQADVRRFNVRAAGCWIKQGAGRGSFAAQIDPPGWPAACRRTRPCGAARARVPPGHPATHRAHGHSEQWLTAAHNADSAFAVAWPVHRRRPLRTVDSECSPVAAGQLRCENLRSMRWVSWCRARLHLRCRWTGGGRRPAVPPWSLRRWRPRRA